MSSFSVSAVLLGSIFAMPSWAMEEEKPGSSKPITVRADFADVEWGLVSGQLTDEKDVINLSLACKRTYTASQNFWAWEGVANKHSIKQEQFPHILILLKNLYNNKDTFIFTINKKPIFPHPINIKNYASAFNSLRKLDKGYVERHATFSKEADPSAVICGEILYNSLDYYFTPFNYAKLMVENDSILE
ncbi:MAG TPA: hypothetical protein VMW10_09115 [Alphaproteobacteria bacterium]|nr:hypothetical protein [Alphaproteobacteria bacterium]